MLTKSYSLVWQTSSLDWSWQRCSGITISNWCPSVKTGRGINTSIHHGRKSPWKSESRHESEDPCQIGLRHLWGHWPGEGWVAGYFTNRLKDFPKQTWDKLVYYFVRNWMRNIPIPWWIVVSGLVKKPTTVFLLAVGETWGVSSHRVLISRSGISKINGFNPRAM